MKKVETLRDLAHYLDEYGLSLKVKVNGLGQWCATLRTMHVRDSDSSPVGGVMSVRGVGHTLSEAVSVAIDLWKKHGEDRRGVDA